MILNYHMILFTDYTVNDKFAFQMGYSHVFFAGMVLSGNIGYILWKEIDKYMTKRRLLMQQKDWRSFLHERQKLIELKKEMKAALKADPDMQKPKLSKQRNVPTSYAKKIMVKKTGLQVIEEEENSQDYIEKEINETIFQELGNFGDIVELSRKQILEGYVRPKRSKGFDVKTVTILPVPQEIDRFKETFDVSSRNRWSNFVKEHPEEKENVTKEMA